MRGIKMARKKKDLIDELGTMSVNKFLNVVAQASEQRNAKIDRLIADAVAQDIQAHLALNEIKPVCPYCEPYDPNNPETKPPRIRKHGKQHSIPRYRCMNCGHTFTQLAGTILDKTQYSWDIWVEVIKGMLTLTSVEKTRQILEDDYHCTGIHTMTVWRMRLKVMYAISKLPSPTLTGIVQIDDTFLREDQKASRHLVNPLSKDILKKRKPRKHKIKPKLGIRGNEYATITTAMDTTGHCVCRVLSCGVVPEDILGDFITEHTTGILFACSDADDTYRRVFAKLNIAHYIHPSNYLEITKSEGIITSESDEADEDCEDGLTEEQKQRNKVIRERLWSKGQIDRIANRGKMSYEMFRKLKDDNKLSINSINNLHLAIKTWLKQQTRGVSTKYLPYYVAWFEYTYNRKVDKGSPLVSKKDAEAILIEAIGAHANLTYEEIEEIRHSPLALPKTSGRYLHMLEEQTAKIRIELRNPDFYFGDENGGVSFDKKRVLASMSDAQLRELATRLKMKGWGTLKRSALIEELRKHPDIKDHLFIVAVTTSGHKTKDGKYDYKHNRPLLPSLFLKDRFVEPKDATGKVVFLDTETTGIQKGYDEIVQVAIVDMEGEILYDSLIKPKHHKRWGKAQEVHGISPYDVQDAPSLEHEKEKIEAILAETDVIVGWNVRFDLDMLYANGIDVPNAGAKYCDLMMWFYKAYLRRNPYKDRDKEKRKLVEASTYLRLEHKAHDALGDASVLIPIWEWVLDDTIPDYDGKREALPF